MDRGRLCSRAGFVLPMGLRMWKIPTEVGIVRKTVNTRGLGRVRNSGGERREKGSGRRRW